MTEGIFGDRSVVGSSDLATGIDWWGICVCCLLYNHKIVVMVNYLATSCRREGLNMAAR